MARILDVATESVREKIQLEGRPVNLSVSLEGSGDSLAGSGTPPVYNDISVGFIGVDPGRAIMTKSITITSNAKGRVSGVIAQNAIADWIGFSNQDEFSLAISDAGVVSLDFDGFILLPGSRVSLTFTPYPETGQTDPDIGMHINGIEFTADFNFGASKKLLYCGDSISWSLLGNWRPQDLGYNYSGNRKESVFPYPEYFGDELASFRLVNALRTKTTPESIRLVNKGFGGSRLTADQWFASRSGMYSFPWNMMIMQAGVNDAVEIQTPLRQLTMAGRIKDIVNRRNNDGRKNYPIVFCTPPALDDRYDGEDSRLCLDQRPPVLGSTNEGYTYTFDSTNLDTLDFSNSSENHWIKVEASGITKNDLKFQGGTPNHIYRIDFITETNLLTGTTSNTDSWIRTSDSLKSPNDANLQNDGIITIPENTTLFIKCNTADTYEEIDRASLTGTALAVDADTFDTIVTSTLAEPDPIQKHFITAKNTTRTEILGPAAPIVVQNPNITETVIKGVGPSRGIVQLTLSDSAGFTINSGLHLSALGWPDASVIEDSDIWVRLRDMQDTSNPGETSWSDVNGYYKVINYGTNTKNYTDNRGPIEVVTNIQIQLDVRDSGTTRKFDGTYVDYSGKVEILQKRSYIAEFEGSSHNDTSNCSFFQAGSRTIPGSDYTVEIQLTDGKTSFDLVAGQGICFSVYQQGNIIYMNEIASGSITNVGKVLGTSSLSNFWQEGSNTNELGLTRLQIVRNVIQSTVQSSALASDNVHLVDLYDINDLKDTVQTTGGRLIYQDVTFKGGTTPLLINNLIEDPLFKTSSNTGINERVVGRRLHRSPKGHEKIFQRLYNVISNITIPN